MKTPRNIEEHITNAPEDVQGKLIEIRETIETIVPQAQGVISYGIPTFKLNGKNLIHFAGFKDHLSLFPGSSGVEAFRKELSGYKLSKGTIRFPIDKPLPIALIKKIIRFRVKEITEGR